MLCVFTTICNHQEKKRENEQKNEQYSKFDMAISISISEFFTYSIKYLIVMAIPLMWYTVRYDIFIFKKWPDHPIVGHAAMGDNMYK